MTGILQRYWMIFTIVGFLIALSLLWLFISKHDSKKIPSRGVFVIQSTLSTTNNS